MIDAFPLLDRYEVVIVNIIIIYSSRLQNEAQNHIRIVYLSHCHLQD